MWWSGSFDGVSTSEPSVTCTHAPVADDRVEERPAHAAAEVAGVGLAPHEQRDVLAGHAELLALDAAPSACTPSRWPRGTSSSGSSSRRRTRPRPRTRSHRRRTRRGDVMRALRSSFTAASPIARRPGVGDGALQRPAGDRHEVERLARDARAGRSRRRTTPRSSGRRWLSIVCPCASAMRSTSRAWLSVSTGMSTPGMKTAAETSAFFFAADRDQVVAERPAQHRQPTRRARCRTRRACARARRRSRPPGTLGPPSTWTTSSASTYGKSASSLTATTGTPALAAARSAFSSGRPIQTTAAAPST